MTGRRTRRTASPWLAARRLRPPSDTSEELPAAGSSSARRTTPPPVPSDFVFRSPTPRTSLRSIRGNGPVGAMCGNEPVAVLRCAGMNQCVAMCGNEPCWWAEHSFPKGTMRCDRKYFHSLQPKAAGESAIGRPEGTDRRRVGWNLRFLADLAGAKLRGHLVGLVGGSGEPPPTLSDFVLRRRPKAPIDIPRISLWSFGPRSIRGRNKEPSGSAGLLKLRGFLVRDGR